MTDSVSLGDVVAAWNKLQENRTEQLVESFAELAHQIWSEMIDYCLHIGAANGPEFQRKSIWEKWQNLAQTPYEKLSGKEKDSDRFIARRYLELLSEGSSAEESSFGVLLERLVASLPQQAKTLNQILAQRENALRNLTASSREEAIVSEKFLEQEWVALEAVTGKQEEKQETQTMKKKSLHERVLAVKQRFIEHLWKTTTAFGYLQNTLSDEESRLMEEIMELEEETKELREE